MLMACLYGLLFRAEIWGLSLLICSFFLLTALFHLLPPLLGSVGLILLSVALL